MSTQITISPEIKLVVNTTPITGGSAGQILFQTTGNTVGESANLFWDNTNGRLGIGTSSPTSRFHIVGAGSTSSTFSLRVQNSLNESAITVRDDRAVGLGRSVLSGESYGGISIGHPDPANILHSAYDAHTFNVWTGGAYATALLIKGNGAASRVLIGTTTDAGFRLDVNGTARVQDSVTVSRNQNATTGITLANTTSGAAAASQITIQSTSSAFVGKFSSSTTAFRIITPSDLYLLNQTAGDIAIHNDFATGKIKFANGPTASAQATLFSTGNFAINTTTDAGFRLDVNGTARVQGLITGTAGITISGSSSFTSGYLGIASTGSGGIYGLTANQPLYIWNRQTSTGNGIVIDDFNGVGANSISLNLLNISGSYNTSGTCVHNTLMISRAINMPLGNQTVRGFYYNPTLTNTTGLVAHFAFHSTSGRVRFEGLPTSSAGLSSGEIWNDGGTLKIV